MIFVVLGGSPKGEVSVTMQYVGWLRQNCTDHHFEVIQVAAPIRKLERDPEAMAEIGETVARADGILWAFPLYVAMPHAGLKRFVELIRERNIAGAFRGKRCAILTTSIHFFDHTAVEYMRGISEDLGMVVDEVFSAGMNDLLRTGGTEQLSAFLQKWTARIEAGTAPGRRTTPIPEPRPLPYAPPDTPPRVRPVKVGIVTQSGVSENLDSMVARMAAHFAHAELFDLTEMDIAGNCTGCLRCGYDNTCLYAGKDEVIDTYRKLGDCDAVLFCGCIVDRYFSARWKTFVDRMFFSTHVPVLPGKPLGFVVSGPLSGLINFRNIMEGVYGAMQMRPAGFACDEAGDVDGELAALADSLQFLAETGYAAPQQFPAIYGRKVFRDEVYGGLNGVFPADHRYYKKEGWYRDFPQRKIRARLGGWSMRTAMKIPPVRKNMQDNMKTNMLMSFRRVVRQEEGEKPEAPLHTEPSA